MSARVDVAAMAVPLAVHGEEPLVLVSATDRPRVPLWCPHIPLLARRLLVIALVGLACSSDDSGDDTVADDGKGSSSNAATDESGAVACAQSAGAACP